MKKIIILNFFFSTLLLAQTPVKLQPWTIVKGGTEFLEQLGKFVGGIPANTNIPFRANVGREKDPSLFFYTLINPTDTSVKKTMDGTGTIVGDLNNDGYQDLCIRGRAPTSDIKLYWGNSTGFDTSYYLSFPNTGSNREFLPQCIGDLSGDGKPDLIISDINFNGGRGKISIYFNPVHSSEPDITLLGDTFRNYLGTKVTLGDIDGDNKLELLTSLTNYNTDKSTNLRIYKWVVDHFEVYKNFGYWKESWGASTRFTSFDANGDHIDDIFWFQDGTYNVYLGSHNFDTIPDYTLQEPASLGTGHAIINGGDMNGDGYNDLVINGIGFSSHYILVYSGGKAISTKYCAAVGWGDDSWFGSSMAPIGDINEDGCADVIVGASEWDWGSGKGAWAIYLGSRSIPTSVEDEKIITPKTFKLYQNYPNPFNSSTTIKYEIRKKADIQLSITDILGKKKIILSEKEQLPGEYELRLDSDKYKLSSGSYYLNLTSGLERETIKLVIIK